MNEERLFYINLWTILLALIPIDTGNMITHTSLEDYGEWWKLIISGPLPNGEDYARAVNEGLNAKMQGRQRSAKEEKNYHFVQRAIEQAAQLSNMNIAYYEGDGGGINGTI